MIKVNLLTGKKVKKRKERKARGPVGFLFILIVLTLVSVLLSGFGVNYFKSRISELQAEEESNKATLSILNKKIAEVKRYEKLNKEIDERNKIIETLKKNQAVPAMILDRLSHLIPEGIWLDSLIYKDHGVILEGYGFTNEGIVSYVDKLKRAENFIDVYLEESRHVEGEKVSVYRFKLNFKVRI